MTEAYIVDAVRTPIGKKNGGLSGVHPADLGAHVIKAIVNRTGIDPAGVDDVVFGCVDAIGGQAGNIARTAWLAAGYPEEVPVSPSTVSAGRVSRPCTSAHRRSSAAPPTSFSPAACRT